MQNAQVILDKKYALQDMIHMLSQGLPSPKELTVRSVLRREEISRENRDRPGGHTAMKSGWGSCHKNNGASIMKKIDRKKARKEHKKFTKEALLEWEEYSVLIPQDDWYDADEADHWAADWGDIWPDLYVSTDYDEPHAYDDWSGDVTDYDPAQNTSYDDQWYYRESNQNIVSEETTQASLDFILNELDQGNITVEQAKQMIQWAL